MPAQATQLLDLTGRHLRERSPQRHDFTLGTHLRENRRGRTGTDASLVFAAGTPGFTFRSGDVWAMHVAWSGNHRLLAERTPGLDADGTYRLTPLEPGNAPEGPTTAPLPWWATQPELPGRMLAEVGVQAPTMFPERLVLLDVQRIS